MNNWRCPKCKFIITAERSPDAPSPHCTQCGSALDFVGSAAPPGGRVREYTGEQVAALLEQALPSAASLLRELERFPSFEAAVFGLGVMFIAACKAEDINPPQVIRLLLEMGPTQEEVAASLREMDRRG